MNTASGNRFRFDRKVLAAFVAGALSLMAVASASQANAQATTTASTTATSTGSVSGTVTSSTAPVISGVALISVDPAAGTATIGWTTDIPSTGQAFYGLSQSFDQSSTYQSSLTTSHTAVLTGLRPDTTYFFNLGSNSSDGMNTLSVDYMFTMPPLQSSSDNGSTTGTTTTGTTTGSSTTASSTSADIVILQNRISQLESIVSSLQSQLATLWADFQNLINNGQGSGGSIGSGTGSQTGNSNGSTTSAASSGIVSPNNSSVRAGTTVDFTGRGFWNGEPVRVMNNGQTVATAQADGGGNFSTGSLSVASTTGNQTYTFIGQWSGITSSATITVTP